MVDHEERIKEFLRWLESRVLQREYTYARMDNGRNKELLKAELAEAKLIRDRFRAMMLGAVADERRSDAAARVVPLRHRTAVEMPESDAMQDLEVKPRVVH